MAGQAVAAFLKAVDQRFPVIGCVCDANIPRVVIVVLIWMEEREFVAYHLACRGGWRRVEVVAELVGEANCWCLASFEVHEDEALGCDV